MWKKITREQWNEIPDDYKGVREDGTKSMLKMVDWATCSVPVEIID